jgi:hypothetical protein
LAAWREGERCARAEKTAHHRAASRESEAAGKFLTAKALDKGEKKQEKRKQNAAVERL